MHINDSLQFQDHILKRMMNKTSQLMRDLKYVYDK